MRFIRSIFLFCFGFYIVLDVSNSERKRTTAHTVTPLKINDTHILLLLHLWGKDVMQINCVTVTIMAFDLAVCRLCLDVMYPTAEKI